MPAKPVVNYYLLIAAIAVLTFCYPTSANAQKEKIDSLEIILKSAPDDTAYARLQNDIGLLYIDISSDSALKLWTACDSFANEKSALHSGIFRERLLSIQGDALSNIAYVYTQRGMTGPALDYNFRSLKLRESIHDQHGIAESLNNIAFIYIQQKDTVNALVYYVRSAEGYEAIYDLGGVAYTEINRARIYAGQHRDSLAIALYTNAMGTLATKPEWHRGYSSCLHAIGLIYLRMERYDTAAKYFRAALVVRQENNDAAGIAGSYVGIGRLYKAEGIMDSALYYAQRGYELSRSIRNATSTVSSAQLLSEIHRSRGDYEQALKFYTIYVGARDSMNDEEAGKQMVRQQMGYEYAKQVTADSLVFAQDKEVGELKLSRQRGYTIGGFSALAIVAVLLLFVYRQRNRISKEKKRSEELLLNILPSETAEELKATGTAQPKSYESVTVMFTDFKNFTKTAEQLSAEELVALINLCYAEFDRIVSRHNLEKIKTIGDSYMCAGGLPVPGNTHAVDAVEAAMEMITFIHAHNAERRQKMLPYFDIRIGLHTGPVVAGIVGIKKFAYDIWGDTVNIASRMESSGEPGRINISETTYKLVKDKFACEYRGKVQAKNKGEIDMYFVSA